VRLNGWQRIEVVVAVVWVIGGGLWGNEVGLSQGDWVPYTYQRCLSERSVQPDGTVPRDTDRGPCTARFKRDWPEAIKNHSNYAMAFAFLPLPIGWLVFWGLAGLTRWLGAGFNKA
jgi:hypothetical protein